MTLEQLRIFVAVARSEHLTRGAKSVHRTPSAVSAAIRTLESHFELPLFDRVGRGLMLTDAGRRLMGEAEAVLARAGAAETAMEELKGLKGGVLSVFASQTVASHFVPPLLMSFHARHPAIEIRLAIGNTATAAEALIAGTAEIALVEGRVDRPGLDQRAVAQDRLAVVVAPGHPWAARERLTAQELAAGSWVMREQGSGTRAAFEQALEAEGVTPDMLDVVLELPSNEAVLAAVPAGPCAAVVSHRAAAAAIEDGRLAEAPFALPAREFSLLVRSGRVPSHAARAFEAVVDADRQGGGGPGSPKISRKFT